MKYFILAATLFAGAVAPVMAGTVTVDLPQLTWPSDPAKPGK